MDTLLNICNEEIRKNWPNYEHSIHKESHVYHIMWNNLYEKHGINCTKESVVMLRKFIDSDQQQMILQKLSQTQRTEIHELCDKVGLYHMNRGRNPRLLRVWKPPIWKWEFTEENPVAKAKREEYERKQKRREKRMRDKCCDWCGADALEKELLCSVHRSFICCEECACEASDGNGETLDCHNLHPVDFSE